MSPVEFNLAMQGHIEANGGRKTGITWAEVLEIEKEYGIPHQTSSIRKKNGPNNN